MQYKTIVLEFLQQRPEMHNQLCKDRKLLATLNQLAGDLKTSHEAWKDRLTATRPDTSESQIASEAMELALRELEASLPPASSTDDDPLPLDAAMAFISPTSPA